MKVITRPASASGRLVRALRLGSLSGLLLLPLCLTAARASPPASPIGKVLACRQIRAEAARLTCFDNASAALADASVTLPSPPSEGPKPTRAMKEALDPKRTFGLPRATIVRREAAAAGVQVKDASGITARIVSMGQSPGGQAIFALDNGQVWEQLTADGTSLYTKPGDTVRISRGWLDSYWLEAPSHHGCKVTRLR
ncbi:MAG: hypothetical protein ACRET2_01230 [Steroidobacteraceae bacterium]